MKTLTNKSNNIILNKWEIIIGKTLDEANIIAQKENYTIRPIRINGNPCLTTRDHKSNRINVSIENNLITKIEYKG